MSSSRSRLGVVGACLLFALASPTPAHGLIVVDGKIVPAWPEPPVTAGAQLAAPNIGLYLHPKGSVFGLTLLIDFSDASPAFDKTEVDAWLNQKGYSQGGLNGSVRDYFLDESNGQLDFQNDTFGFYRAKYPKAHYEGTSGYQGADELFAEVLDHFDDSVDFSKYDNDKDGRTDAISIVYAGAAETWGKGLWPHASGSNQKRNGVTIARYMMTNLGTSLGLYTFSHEVGHMLFGWPDLYGFGNYCIMGNSSSQKNPVGINDFYRADQGWIPLVDVTAETNAVFTAELGGAGYRYTNPEDPKESFFWSNVQSSGRFNTISGDGLLLLHFDKNIGINDPPNRLGLAVVQADGKKDLDETMWPSPGSDANDFFHGGGVSEFSSAKFQTASWHNGSPSQLHIYDVAAVSDKMQFKVGNGPIVTQPEPSAGAGGVAGGSAGTAGAMSSAGGGGVPVGGQSASGGAVGLPAGGSAGSQGGLFSMAGTGAAGSPSAPGLPSAGEASCSCRVRGPRERAPLALLALCGALALVRSRRR